LSDIGRIRQRNEDQFLIADMTRSIAMLHSIASQEHDCDPQDMLNANLMLVADGVGGHPGGEKASRLAMEAVVEYLHENQMLAGQAATREEQICEELKSALAWAQERIAAAAEESPQFASMGTTLTLAYLIWPTAYIAHCGDSRAYIYGGDEIVQITRDQTIPQMLADMGALDQSLVEVHPLRNALGSLLSCDARQFMPRVYYRRLMPGDKLLLCTDGLTKHVSAARIAEILDSAHHAPDACRELAGAANDAGGTDNVTVVLAHFGHRLEKIPDETAFGQQPVRGSQRPGREMAFSA
jgi:protein phosphatase